jgi:hypothetical protein
LHGHGEPPRLKTQIFAPLKVNPINNGSQGGALMKTILGLLFFAVLPIAVLVAIPLIFTLIEIAPLLIPIAFVGGLWAIGKNRC